MKVLLINNCHYRRGGADVVYLNTGKLLESHGQMVAYFSTNSGQNEPTRYSEFFVDDVDALKLGFLQQLLKMPRKLYSFEARRNLKRLLNSFKPDIVHIHLYKGGLTASILPVLKRHKIPVVISLHDYSLLCPHNILVDGDGNLCERCINSSPLNCIIHRCNRKNIFFSTVNYIEYIINNRLFRPEKFFDRIICVCKFNLEKHSIKPNLKDRLIHLYNFSPYLKDILPNHEKGDYFLFYGRLKKIKGILTLIDAWQKLKKNNLKLKVAGDGNLSLQIQKKIKDEAISNIEILGYKSGNELDQLIRNASFVVIPSECYENNPMTIIEGYSYGKPIIASHVGGIPEIIEEGKTGFTFEMRNSAQLANMIEYAGNISSNDYREMSINARLYVEKHFSPETHFEKLNSVYKEVIENYGKQ